MYRSHVSRKFMQKNSDKAQIASAIPILQRLSSEVQCRADANTCLPVISSKLSTIDTRNHSINVHVILLEASTIEGMIYLVIFFWFDRGLEHSGICLPFLVSSISNLQPADLARRGIIKIVKGTSGLIFTYLFLSSCKLSLYAS